MSAKPHPDNRPGMTYDMNARRREAAVAACDGFPTEALERGMVKELFTLASFLIVTDHMAPRENGHILISERMWQDNVRALIDRLNDSCRETATH